MVSFHLSNKESRSFMDDVVAGSKFLWTKTKKAVAASTGLGPVPDMLTKKYKERLTTETLCREEDPIYKVVQHRAAPYCC